MGDPVCLDENKDNCSKDSGLYPDRPPRLVAGINRSPTARPVKPRSVPADSHPDGDDPILCPAGVTYLKEVLEHIANGFTAHEMELAWSTDAGKGGRVMESGETPEQVWEIYWAKQVVEMFLQNSYDMPEVVASFPWDVFKDQDATKEGLTRYQGQTFIFQRLQLKYVPVAKWGRQSEREKWGVPEKPNQEPPELPWELNTDPAYSLATECQHLTTYLLISRGFLVERDMKCCGVTAGTASQSCQMFAASRGGRWVGENDDGKFASADHAIDELGLTPGAIYVFDPKHGANSALQLPGSHIWPVLRIDRDGKRIQNLEGGGEEELLPPPPWSSSVPTKSVYVGAAGGKDDARQEGTWRAGATNPADVCGLGVPPVAKDLDKAVAHMMRARPVGLARLAIQRRKATPATGQTQAAEIFTPIYISSFIRMWGKGELDNYAPSRFLMSLRSTPYFEDLRAYWFLYAPRWYLGWLMWQHDARNTQVRDFFEQSLRLEWQKQAETARRTQTPVPSKRMRLSRQDLQCPLILSHDELGFAKFRWRHVVSGSTPKEVDATWNPKDIDNGLEKIMLMPDSSSSDLLAGLDTRWDAEYFHPSIRPGGRHVPEFFDFEEAFPAGNS